MTDRKIIFSEGNEPATYFELSQLIEPLSAAWARRTGLPHDIVQELRGNLTRLLNKEMRALRLTHIHAPLPRLMIDCICVQWEQCLRDVVKTPTSAHHKRSLRN